MTGLSKSRIQAHRQCPKRLWLQINRPELAQQDAGNQARFATGHLVGQVARSLYPEGILIDAEYLRDALSQTRLALENCSRPLFEATFERAGVLVRADLLLPDGERYRMVEVKSAASVKDYYQEDAAIQAWVVRQAGIPLASVEIAHINTQFVYQGDGHYGGLFQYVDVTDALGALESAVPAWIEEARTTLDGMEPEIAVGTQCHSPFDCPFLLHCAPNGAVQPERYPVDILPRARELPDQLRAEGYEDLRDVPAGRLANPVFERMRRASVSGQPELDPAAGKEIWGLGYPRYYIDFETIAMAVPTWTGTRPYQAVPFQWSCHMERRDGTLEHCEFLSAGTGDPRRAFAETLIAALGDGGPILVYNAGTERSHLKNIAKHFTDLALVINAAIARIVDLLPIARSHYYHPAMRGSWSIKNVLPTIAPELAYQGKEVADGMMAQVAFAELMNPATPSSRQAQIRSALLDYCALDTLAMVKLVHFFEKG